MNGANKLPMKNMVCSDIKLTDFDIKYLEEMYVLHPVVSAINHNPKQGVVLLDEKK